MSTNDPRSIRNSADDEALLRFLEAGPVVVLSGAGVSTDSGIPDYRGPDGQLRNRLPMRLQEFMGSPEARTRYWARSMVGWPRFTSAAPNAAHRALAGLEALGALSGVITQNVDGLHQSGGSREVVELHGSLAGVRCMGCSRLGSRAEVQQRLEALNPSVQIGGAIPSKPDGDAALPEGIERGFTVPECDACGGVLKPDVVFFGESVPLETVARSWRLYEHASALLVLGSSLSVFSGRRFVLRAAKENRPLAIVNLGPTRGDENAALKLERGVGDVLPRLAEAYARRSVAVKPAVRLRR